MRFNAKARNIRFSPYKLRPFVDVIRGKNVLYALNWLSTQPIKRVTPIKKIVASAAANAKYLKDIDASKLLIKKIEVDQGPMFRYFKPGAMGRANVQRRRFSHLNVVLESIDNKEV
jgi:large subunit ribosomal protein L22